MKELRKILIAAVVLVGLAIAVSYKRKQDYETSVAEEEAKKLVQIDLEKISRIDVENDKGKITFLRRAKKGEDFQDLFAFYDAEFDSVPDWRINAPFKGLPDFYQINNFINTVKNFSQTKVVDETGKRLEEYGLDEGAAKVEFYAKPEASEPKLTLWIGDENSASTGLYAKTSENSEIVLANFTLRYLKDRSLEEWRKKEIIGIQKLQDVQSLALTFREGGESRELVLKKDKAKWFLNKPLEAKADFKAVEDYLSEIKSLRANKILSDQFDEVKKEYGFENPFLTIRFEVDENGKLVEKIVEVGSKIEENKDIFVRRGKLPQIFSVRPGMKNSLTTSVEALISKHPFSLRRSLVSEINIERKGEKIALEQKDGKFYLSQPVSDWADPGAVATFFDSLLDLKAKAFLAEESEGKMNSKIELISDDRKETLLLKSLAEAYRGKVQPGGLLYSFDKKAVDALWEAARDLREKRLTLKDKGELESVVVRAGQVKGKFVNSETAKWVLGSLESDEAKLRAKLRNPDVVKEVVETALGIRAGGFPAATKVENAELEIEFLPKEGDPIQWSFEKLKGANAIGYSKDRKIAIEVPGEKLRALMKYFELEEKKEES